MRKLIKIVLVCLIVLHITIANNCSAINNKMTQINDVFESNYEMEEFNEERDPKF